TLTFAEHVKYQRAIEEVYRRHRIWPKENASLSRRSMQWCRRQTSKRRSQTRNQVADIQNSGHAPGDPSESATIADLQLGNYTAIVRGLNNTTGVVLVGVYDLDR